MEIGGRDTIMQGGIRAIFPYPSQEKAKKIKRRHILILNYKDIIGRLRTRDE
jgi:hypothetical protein